MATLAELRGYVANVLDYDPQNPTYRAQVDAMLNEAHRRIVTEKPWTFINKVADVIAYPDRSATMSFSTTTGSVTTGSAFFTNDMVGMQVEVENGSTYEIAWVETSTQAWLTTAFTDGLPTTRTAKVVHRFLDMPQDCVQVLGLSRRVQELSATDPGQLLPLMRYEDEWYNLPLGEVNLPNYWIEQDPAYTAAPRQGVTLVSTVEPPGQGVRTLEIAVAHSRAARLSPLTATQTVTLSDTQGLDLDFQGIPDETGYYRQVYYRAPTIGLQEWRRLPGQNAWPYTGIRQDPNTASGVSAFRISLADLQSEVVWLLPRLERSDGFIARMRLYPRQDKQYTFQCRYIQRPPLLVEDTDVPAIPTAHALIVAYRALADLLVKHDNAPQAELFKRRYAEELLKMERRYLITPGRRIVKGDWQTSTDPTTFSRYGRLVHT